MMAFCDANHLKSLCSSQIYVSATNEETTTTSESEVTTETSTTTPSGGGNMVLYVLILVIIVVIAFIAYRMFAKKKPRVNYETLYRKWGR